MQCLYYICMYIYKYIYYTVGALILEFERRIT
jgi:hypothetical protein